MGGVGNREGEEEQQGARKRRERGRERFGESIFLGSLGWLQTQSLCLSLPGVGGKGMHHLTSHRLLWRQGFSI